MHVGLRKYQRVLDIMVAVVVTAHAAAFRAQ